MICEFCKPRPSPVDGRILRACQWCVTRTDDDAWCECTFCPWL